MKDLLYVNGGNPLKGEITVRGAKNFVSKAMVAALLGETPSRAAQRAARSATSASSPACSSCTASRSTPTTPPATLRLDPTHVESGARRRHRRARRLQPHPDPLLRAAAAPARRGVHPDLGGCQIGDRPIDFHLDILRQFGAVVDKRENGIHIRAPHGLHGTKIALPYPSVGATEQLLLTAVRAEGITELSQRGHRARDHGPHRRPAEDGRDHLGGHRPGHPHRGRRPARRVPAHARSPTASRPRPGPRPPSRPAATSTCAAPSSRTMTHVPQHLPQGRRRVRDRRRRHPVLPPGRRPQARSPSRRTCTPAS